MPRSSSASFNQATHVKALFFGHRHLYQVSSTNGLHLVQLRSAAYNFDPAQPIGWVQMALASSGAQLTLRINSGNIAKQGSVTNLAWR